MMNEACHDTLNEAKNETYKLQMILEEHMLKDSFPPEKIELLKAEIKDEVKNELNSLNSNIKRTKDN